MKGENREKGGREEGLPNIKGGADLVGAGG